MQNTKMVFGESGVSSKLIDKSNVVLTKTELKKEAFVEYEAMGEIFIADLEKLIKIVQSFEDVINIKVVENFFKIFDASRTVDFPLASVEACDNIFDKDFKMQEGMITFDVDKSFIVAALNDVAMLGESGIRFVLEGGVLKTFVGKDHIKTENKINIGVEGSASVIISEMLKNIISESESALKIRIGKDLPMVIMSSSESVALEAIIAPRIEEE